MKTQIAKNLTILGALMAAAVTAQSQYIFTPLAFPGAVGTSARGISGTNIVGFYVDTNGDVYGFLYNGGTNWTSLNDPLSGPGLTGGTGVTRISGTNAVGFYWDTNGNQHGFLHSGADWSTNWTTIDDPNGVSSTTPWGISGSNIVGQYTDASGNTHGFLYNGAAWTTLDDPLAAPGSSGGTYAFDISGSNVVGYYVNGGGQTRGFLYNVVSQAWTALNDPLQEYGTGAAGISGTNIVGDYWDRKDNVHGFLHSGTNWSVNWTTFDNPLAPVGHYPAGGTFLRGIDGARMVGDYYVNGNPNGFLATPIPQLAITQSGNSLNLSWPYDPFINWTLQQNADVTTTNWTPAPTGALSNDGTNIFIPITPSPGNLFFRLIH